MNTRVWLPVFAALGSSLIAAQASAHIQLTCPPARYAYNATGIKTGPCGATTGSKSNKVTHLIAGQQLTVAFTETVYHPGFFRISLDTTGAEGFPAISMTPQNPVMPPVLADNILMHTSGSSNAKRTATITVPSTTCTKCVLQLTQFMSDNPNAGYYECADVVIDAAGSGADFSCGGATGMGGKGGAGGKPGAGGSTGNGGSSSSGGATGSGGVVGSGGATASGGATSSGGSSSSGGATSSGGSSSSGGATSSGGSSSGGATASGGTSSSGGSNGSGGSASNGSGGSSSNGSGGSKGATDDGAGGCTYVGGQTSLIALAASIGGLVIALRRRTRRAGSAPRPSV